MVDNYKYNTDFTLTPTGNGDLTVDIQSIETDNYLQIVKSLNLTCQAPKLWTEVEYLLSETKEEDVSDIVKVGDYVIITPSDNRLNQEYDELDITDITNNTRYIGLVRAIHMIEGTGFATYNIHNVYIEILYRDSKPILFKSKNKGSDINIMLDNINTVLSSVTHPWYNEYGLDYTHLEAEDINDWMDTSFYNGMYLISSEDRIKSKENKDHLLNDIKFTDIALFRGFDMDICSIDIAGNLLSQARYSLINLPDYSNLYVYLTPVIIKSVIAW